MSQPQVLPSTPDSDGVLLLTTNELALLSYIGGRLPLVLPSVEHQPDEVWSALLAETVARGLLIEEGEDRVGVSAELVDYLAPVIQADFLLDANVEGTNFTWMAADRYVIVAQPMEPPHVRVVPIEFDDLEQLAQMFLRLEGESRGADGDAIEIPSAEFAGAVKAYEAGEPIELAAAPEFAAALTGGQLRQAEVRWLEGSDMHARRYEWVDAGDALWAITAGGDSVTVRPQSTATLWEEIGGLLP